MIDKEEVAMMKQKLFEASPKLLQTLEVITSDFLMAKFVEVAKVEGFEFVLSYYSKPKHYTFRITETRVPSNKLLNFLRVRLYHDRWCAAVYELKNEAFIYLVEIWKDRGKRTDLEMVRLHYDFGENDPNKETLGCVRVGSYSIIGLMTEKQACELIEKLVREGWGASL